MVESALWKLEDDGYRVLVGDNYVYEDLDHSKQEIRFLILEPCGGDKGAVENHVRCSFEIHQLAHGDPPPFIAVTHSRGYRLMKEAIELCGKSFLVTIAHEQFLRYFRKSNEPVRLWLRHICLEEADMEERTRYWTRPFIDLMYTKAASCVSMTDFLYECIGKGLVRNMLDDKHATWTKEWDTVPKYYVTPAVFPIKLGKQHSVESPYQAYEWVPLDPVASEIRVVVVSGAKEATAPLSVGIAHCPIRCEVAFMCLSYMWGLDTENSEIECNGLTLSVRKSVETALKNLRREEPKQEIVLWVDSMCIDQFNIAERSRQIARIYDIFDCAGGVICYLGEADEDSDLALDFIPYCQSPRMFRNHDGSWHFTNYEKDAKPLDPAQVPRLCGALYRLLTRPYFKRVWILQEIAAATNAYIFCGTKQMKHTLEQLQQAAFNLQYIVHGDYMLTEQIIEATPGLTELSREELSYIRVMFYFRHLARGGWRHGFMSEMTITKTNVPGFLETAILARRFEATVASDKIYALWNLAKDKGDFDFKPDYALTTSEAFTSFAIAWSKHSGSLDIIGAAEASLHSYGFYETAPSWCPDWSVRSIASCLVRKDFLPDRDPIYVQQDMDGPLYTADGGMTQRRNSEEFFHFDGKTLHSAGLIVTHIRFVYRANSDEEHIWSDLLGSTAQLAEIYRNDDFNTYDDARRAFWAAMMGDNIAAWPRQQDSPLEGDDQVPDAVYVCLPELSRHMPRWARSYIQSQSADVRNWVMRGREFAITVDGYIALIPKYLTDCGIEPQSMLIAILATCSTPVLLKEESGGVYQFLGTCFVQGWMDGEMVTENMGVDTAEEFWNSMEGVDKLHII